MQGLRQYPRLPVEIVRKILSDTNTTAAPTEPSATTCFDALEFLREMAASFLQLVWILGT